MEDGVTIQMPTPTLNQTTKIKPSSLSSIYLQGA
jgi:hypothetical protein